MSQFDGIPILINDHLLPGYFLRSFWWLDEEYRLEVNTYLADIHNYKPDYYVETIPGMIKGTTVGAKRIITNSLGAQMLCSIATNTGR